MARGVVQATASWRRRRRAPEPAVLPLRAGQVVGPWLGGGDAVRDIGAVAPQRRHRDGDAAGLGLLAAKDRHHRVLLDVVVQHRLGDRVRHHRMRRHFEEQAVAVLCGRGDGFGEAHPPAQVGDPVVGIARGERAWICQSGRVQRHHRRPRWRQPAGQTRQVTGERVHRRTVERHVGVDAANLDTVSGPCPRDGVDRVGGTGYDRRFRRRADRGDDVGAPVRASGRPRRTATGPAPWRRRPSRIEILWPGNTPPRHLAGDRILLRRRTRRPLRRSGR